MYQRLMLEVIMKFKLCFYGISSFNCKNVKLFDFVCDNQKTGDTVLQVRTRTEDGINSEILIGLPINVYDDGSIDYLSLMEAQNIWDNDEHAKASGVKAKIYFL